MQSGILPSIASKANFFGSLSANFVRPNRNDLCGPTGAMARMAGTKKLKPRRNKARNPSRTRILARSSIPNIRSTSRRRARYFFVHAFANKRARATPRSRTGGSRPAHGPLLRAGDRADAVRRSIAHARMGPVRREAKPPGGVPRGRRRCANCARHLVAPQAATRIFRAHLRSVHLSPAAKPYAAAGVAKAIPTEASR